MVVSELFKCLKELKKNGIGICMNEKERPYEYIFHKFIANLPLQGGHREYFEKCWKEVNKVYDEQETRTRNEGVLLERQRILKGFAVLNRTMTNKSAEDFIQAMLKIVKEK